MYSQTAKTLIGIAVGHLLKPVAWVSQNGCKFHVETSASAAANGQSWRALCGATGDCYFIHSAKAVRPEMRCATCQELSTTGIQDVADLSTGNAPVIDGLTVGDTGSRNGGQGEPVTADALTETPAAQISLINRLIPKTLPDADFCHCGHPAVHTCPCQAKVCVAHLYDGEGQHVEAQGFCSDCVDLIQAQNRYPDPATHPHFA